MSKRKAPLWFQVPITSPAPPLLSSAVGIERIVVRPAGSYVMQVNVLDSSDARLLRAGITVAHRTRNGDGEWYVAAPTWAGLPDEISYGLGPTGDLPPEIQRRLNLFLRREPIGPFATIEVDRREYVLRGGDEDLLEIRDDTVTVIRDEEVRSTGREISMLPMVKLEPQQRDFILSAMAAIDAVPIAREPTLPERIGPPATGLTSFRPPVAIHDEMLLEEYVSEVFVVHLNRLLTTELEGHDGLTLDEVASVQRDLRGLSFVLEPGWREEFESLLKVLPALTGDDREDVLVRVVDALIGAVRAPKLGNLSGDRAKDVLFRRAEQSLMILVDRCRALDEASSDEAWLAAIRSAEQVEAACAVLDPLFRKPLRRARRELVQIHEDLSGCVGTPVDIELVGMDSEEAFELGRDVEHARWTVARNRAGFIERWPDHAERLRKALKKMRKKL